MHPAAALLRALHEAGIPRHPAISTRARADRVRAEFDGQTSNYVVFDDKLIEILRKYGILPPLAAGAAAGGWVARSGSEPPT